MDQHEELVHSTFPKVAANTTKVDQNLPKLPTSGFVPSLSPRYMDDNHPLSKSPGPGQPPIYWQPG